MIKKDAWKPSGFLPLPCLDADKMTTQNIADYRRIKASGNVTYVRKLDDGTYEMVDGGKIVASTVSTTRKRRA